MYPAYHTLSIGSALGKIVSGHRSTTAGTAIAITNTSIIIAGVWISGDTGNSDLLLVGDSLVDATPSSQRGIVIIPGNQSIFLNINDLSKVYFDVVTTGDYICYAYLQPSTD